MASETPTARSMIEADIQRGITDLLRQLGFLVYHTWISKNSTPGYPDIVAVRSDGKMIAVECKGPRGRVSFEQVIWLDRFGRNRDCLFASAVGPTETEDWVGYDWAIQRIMEVAG